MKRKSIYSKPQIKVYMLNDLMDQEETLPCESRAEDHDVHAKGYVWDEDEEEYTSPWENVGPKLNFDE